ncbi:unnamed protein product, partial [Vitis vinifera]
MRGLTLVPVILLVLVARGNLCSSTKGMFRAIQVCQKLFKLLIFFSIC